MSEQNRGPGLLPQRDKGQSTEDNTGADLTAGGAESCTGQARVLPSTALPVVTWLQEPGFPTHRGSMPCTHAHTHTRAASNLHRPRLVTLLFSRLQQPRAFTLRLLLNADSKTQIDSLGILGSGSGALTPQPLLGVGLECQMEPPHKATSCAKIYPL